MIFWLPRFLICSCASKLAPSPMASMAMTEHTPKTMPRTVRSDRSRWSQRLRIPSRIERWSRSKENSRRNRARLLLEDIGFDRAVAQPDGPMGVVGDGRVVRDHNQGGALLVQLVEQAQDLGA